MMIPSRDSRNLRVMSLLSPLLNINRLYRRKVSKGSSHGGKSGLIFGFVVYMQTYLSRHLGMRIPSRASWDLSPLSLLSPLLNIKISYRRKVSMRSSHGGKSGLIFGFVVYMHTCLGRRLGMRISARASRNVCPLSLLSLLLNLKRSYRHKVSKGSSHGDEPGLIFAITDMSELRQV
jgi:hypothetical protein